MSTTAQRPRPTPAAIRRRRSLASLAFLAAAAAAVIAVRTATSGDGASVPSALPGVVRVQLGGTILVRLRTPSDRRPGAIEAVLREIPDRRVARVGKARITYAVDRAAVAEPLRRALAQGGGDVTVPEHPVSASIAVPLIAQRLRDDCEATALAMVLGYAGRAVGQLTLQRQMAHAKPLDPRTGANGEEVWGDPSLGFVGRADGGGPAGGFGVYQGPIRALAQRHGVAATDLTGAPARRVYGALLAGHPVIAWVALSAGPYASWTSPAGRPIHVNYGEHAIVLTGVGGGEVRVNDPLSGERLAWTIPEFERMWAGLGRRALAV